MRRGGIVARQTGPWGSTVHSLLRYLERVGFEAAPRVVGGGFDEQGREVLTYVEGDVINPRPWTNDGIARLGELLRHLHDIIRSDPTKTPPGDNGSDVRSERPISSVIAMSRPGTSSLEVACLALRIA